VAGTVRIFFAGASGVIGARLVPPPGVTLVADDHAARNGMD
jgi:hypothetical protein